METSPLGYLGQSVSLRQVDVYGSNILNVGTVTSANATVVEEGDKTRHRTVITLKSGVTVASTGNAALGLGKSIYTFPNAKIAVRAASVDIKLTCSGGVVTADTPEVGLGSTIASGANATLGAVGAAVENIMEGKAAADVNGTVFQNCVGYGAASTPFSAPNKVTSIAAGPTVYLNIADTWAGADTITMAGKIVLIWDYVDSV